MIHAIDVLKVLDAFEAMIDRKGINDDAKKAIARELLTSVPQEIMAPGCKNTSEAVRSIIGAYLGIKNDRRDPGKAEEAGNKPQEGSTSKETVPTARPEVEREASSFDGPLAGPGMASEKARTDEKRQARKAHGGSRRNS